MPVVRVTVKCPRPHDQVVLQRAACDAHLHTELVGLTALALVDATHLGGSVELLYMYVIVKIASICFLAALCAGMETAVPVGDVRFQIKPPRSLT